MSTHTALALVLTGSALSFGCSSSSTSPSADVSSSLVGHWASDTCEATPSAGGATHYVQRDYTFSKATLNFSFTLFAEPTCSTKLLRVDLGGDYGIGAPSPAVAQAHEVDFHVTTRALTAFVQNLADGFTSAHCGASTWTVGGTQDITASGCAMIGYGQLSECPTQFDILKLDGTRIFLGVRQNDVDACKAADRPSALQTVAVVKS
jgi:hypothetical protein